MSNQQATPDAMTVRILLSFSQAGDDYQTKYGVPGTIVTLSYQTALFLISQGAAEPV